MMLKNVAPLITIFLISFGCSKKYPGSINANYEGEWHSLETFETTNGVQNEIYFIIAPNKNSEYGFICDVSLNCNPCECELLTKGKAFINRSHTKLFIGSGNGNKTVKLTINEPLHLNANGKWQCTVDNHIMIRN